MSCTSECLWNIIEILLDKRQSLVQHHIESYELFLEHYIPCIISDYNSFTVKKIIDDTITDTIFCKFSNVSYGRASFDDKNHEKQLMLPHHARDKNMTYCIPIYVDVLIEYKKIENNSNKILLQQENNFSSELLAYIPIMKGSKYCNTQNSIYQNIHQKQQSTITPIDAGYFIIKGNEKVVISQERMMDNKCHFSVHKDKKYSHSIEVRSNQNMTQMANVLKILFLSKDGVRGERTFKISFVNLKTPIPLLLLFHCYGITKDKQMIKYIIGNSTNEHLINLLKISIEDYHNTLQQIEKNDSTVEEYIISKFNNKKIQLKYLAKYRILPHIDNENDKLIYIGYMARELLNFILNKGTSIDRDCLTNKKIETTGILLGQLFRKLWKDTLTSLKNSIIKDSDWIPMHQKIFKSTIITNKINNSLATGTWDSKISSENKKFGIAQMLKRLNYTATISHLRRINSPINKTGKLIEPRKLHNSQFGYCCVAESPEGQQIGLIKNLSLTAIISTYTSPKPIEDIIEKQHKNYKNINIDNFDINQVLIFINGKIKGITTKPYDLIRLLKYKRRNGQICYQISISFKPVTKQLHIYTDEGRIMRPLFIVNEQNNTINQISSKIIQSIKNKNCRIIDLLNNGIIEYIDPIEAETIMIARNQNILKEGIKKYIQYSHCEIHNSLIFGVSASLIPFPEHNQAPRVLYQCAQAKQAIGYNGDNMLLKMETINHILNYTQRPIVDTKTSKIIGMNKWPSGENLIVAVNCFGAYNIEDSLIMNKGAIERGLFHITSYKTYKTSLKKETSVLSAEIICIPDEKKCSEMKTRKLYKKLDTNGIVKIGTIVEQHDIIVGKMSPIIHAQRQKNKKNTMQYKDTSIQLKQPGIGIVDQVLVTENLDDDEIIIKIRIRSVRIPEIGDKCCSRHGQKGTIGIILNEEDMPFSENGIVPDIIINPHCLPSRMTIGQILECFLGKYGAITGQYIDATPFEKKYGDMNEIDKLLIKNGFDGSGKEILFNGENGQQIEAKIFIGPTYYQRLKHLVSDKIHARPQGPVNRLTQQPTEGRSRGGGLKLGNMELDCLHAHGLSHFLKGKFFDDSDKFYVYICKKCKCIANANVEKKIFKCNQCNSVNYDFDKIALPTSSKLLFYELMGMGIMTKFHT